MEVPVPAPALVSVVYEVSSSSVSRTAESLVFQPCFLSPFGSLSLLRDLSDLENLRLHASVRMLGTANDVETIQLNLGPDGSSAACP